MEFYSFEKTRGLLDCIDTSPNTSNFFCIIDPGLELPDLEFNMMQLQGQKNACICGFTFFMNPSFEFTSNNDSLCKCFQIVFCPVFSDVGRNTPRWTIRLPLSQHTANNMDYKIINPDDLKRVTAERITNTNELYHFFKLDKFFQSDFMQIALTTFKTRIRKALYPLLEENDSGNDSKIVQSFNIDDLDNDDAQQKTTDIGNVLKLQNYYKDPNIRNSLSLKQIEFVNNIPIIIKSIKRAYRYIDDLTMIDVKSNKTIANVRKDYVSDVAQKHMEDWQAKQLKEIAKAFGVEEQYFGDHHITYKALEDVKLVDPDDIIENEYSIQDFCRRTLLKIAKKMNAQRQFADNSIKYNDLYKIGVYSLESVEEQNLTVDSIIAKVKAYRAKNK